MDRLKSKIQIAETIRIEMARKSIPSKDLAKLLNCTNATMSKIRYGNSSYELMVKAMDLIDNWEN